MRRGDGPDVLPIRVQHYDDRHPQPPLEEIVERVYLKLRQTDGVIAYGVLKADVYALIEAVQAIDNVMR